MVKAITVLMFVLVLAIPAMAQEDYPRIEVGMGYSNIGFPTGLAGETERHSGFAMSTGFNFSRALGIENYTGFYSLGSGVTLISNIVDGKVAWRKSGRVVPYGVAGIGVSYATSGYASSGSAFSTRVGLGADIPLNDAMSLKFDISRMGFHFGTWSSGVNFTTGIVFTLSN
jgi:hypothetical protein